MLPSRVAGVRSSIYFKNAVYCECLCHELAGKSCRGCIKHECSVEGSFSQIAKMLKMAYDEDNARLQKIGYRVPKEGFRDDS